MRLSLTESTLIQLVRAAFPFNGQREPDPPIDLASWSAISDAALQHGLGPLAYASLKARGRLHEPPAHVGESLRAAYRRTNVANWLAYQELSRLLADFEAQQIPAVLLKGGALATSLYADIGLRPFGDLDLMVPRHKVDEAAAILVAQGYRLLPELPAFFQSLKAQTFVRDGPRRAQVDLHWHFSDIPYYRQSIAIEWFWRHTLAAQADGHTVPILTPEAQLLHLSEHLALHNRVERLIWLYDLALLLARYGQQIQWDEVTEAARQFGLSQALHTTLARVNDRWGISVPAHASARLNALRPDRTERVLFALITAQHNDAQAIVNGLSMPGVRAKLGFWLRYLWPSPTYMRERYGIRDARLTPFYYVWRIGRGFYLMMRSTLSVINGR